MHWLLFVLALAAFAVAFGTSSVALMVLCLLAALALMLAGVMRLWAERLGERSRNGGLAMDPEELRRLRERAEARKLSQPQAPTHESPQSSSSPGPSSP